MRAIRSTCFSSTRTLALIVLPPASRCIVRGNALGIPAEQREHEEESDYVGNGHEPALTEPADRRPRLVHQPHNRDPGGRSEPDHRAAETDDKSQKTPIVIVLLHSESGQRNIVEHRRKEAQS